LAFAQYCFVKFDDMPDRRLSTRPPLTIAGPAKVEPAGTPGLVGLLTLAVFVVIVSGLYLARDVMIPVTLAVLLSFLLAPVVNLLRRLHLGRVPSVLLAVFFALGLMLALGSLIGAQIAGLAGDLPRYQETIQHKVEAVQTFATERMTHLLSGFSRQFGHTPAAHAPAQATNTPPPTPVEVREPPLGPWNLAQRVLTPVVGPLQTTFIVFIVAIFALLQQEDLRDRMIRLLGSGDLHRTTVAMDDAGARLSRYFLTQFCINTGFAVIIGAGLLLIGVPSPVLWAILSGLLRFVPYVGAVLSAAFPLALAAAVDPGWSMVLWTAGLYFCVEMFVGQVLEPLLYGHSTGLSPISVVIAAIFWTWLWGPIGLILSTPLTLCLVVLGRHVDRLEFLDVLLGDRPALTPVENFYQRMLAGDPDEAHDQAMLLLKDRSLSSYYDEVALKGLQLAAHDLQRGALSAEHVERIRTACEALVADLADQADHDPGPDLSPVPVITSRAERELPRAPPPADAPVALPPGWGAVPVLCISGRGPLDEAASMMLAQLLGKHGLPARVVSHEAVSRAAIAGLEADGVGLVCISYLEITGSPSHLRNLLRRVRSRLPAGTEVLVGLWPHEASLTREEEVRAMIGADGYTASLREAVAACVDVARGGGLARAVA
jgi:predicted PurR-regulated permease PerM